MSNQQSTPNRAALEEKMRRAEQLKTENAAREARATKPLVNTLETQKRELASALAYLDKLAKEYEARLPQLKAANTPQSQAEIKSIEMKLNLYKTVRGAAGSFEESINATDPAALASAALTMRLAEAELVVANAKMVLEEQTPSINILRAALGQPVRLAPPQMPAVNQLKARLGANAALSQQANAAIHFYQDALTCMQQEDRSLAHFKTLKGKEALQFAATSMKVSSLAGKINQLRNLHTAFAVDPVLKQLFPAPLDVEIPQLPPGVNPQKAKAKPLTGILKDILGIGK